MTELPSPINKAVSYKGFCFHLKINNHKVRLVNCILFVVMDHNVVDMGFDKIE